MSADPRPPAPPLRQRRAIRTDATILESSVHIASEEGWGALTPGHVSEVTGLSRPTVLQRHADRAAVGAAVWRHVADGFTERLQELIDAGTASPVDAATLASRLSPFTDPNESMRAAIELLVVANYTPEVALAIAETLGSHFTRWFSAGRDPRARSLAARRALLVAIAIGYVLETRRLREISIQLDEEFKRLAHALSSPTHPSRLPSAQARHFDAPIAFDTGDPTWDAVLRATLECVGEFGYESATIEAIASRSGFTRTAIFSRYPTKLDLFIDATDRMLGMAAQFNIEYQQSIAAKHGDAIADTCFLREIARLPRRRLRTITLEQVRLAAHHEPLRESIRQAVSQFEALMREEDPTLKPDRIHARLMTEMAISTGLGALAQVSDRVWNLPFDVVLVPWRASVSTATP